MPALTHAALALALTTLALPGTAAAQPLLHHSRSGDRPPVQCISPTFDYYRSGELAPEPSMCGQRTTSSIDATSRQDLRTPDASDAARAADIAEAMKRYERAQPIPAAARPVPRPQDGNRAAPSNNDTTRSPEIVFGAAVLLASAGGLIHARLRRRLAA
jgi:hypothetical protein